MQKPVYRRVWFWLLAIAALIALVSWLRSPEMLFRLHRGKFEQAAQEIEAGHEVAVDFDTGIITDVTTGKSYQAQPFPPFIQNIIKCGGLLNSLREGSAND